MAKARKQHPRTEPAHGFLYEPGTLAPPAFVVDAADLLKRVTPSLEFPFNGRQDEAFRRSFADRLFLLWGPPGTGKTTVVAGMILGWLEKAWASGLPVSIGVGASNYNAIDNVLREVADLLDRRRQSAGDPPLNVRLARVRSSATLPPSDNRIEDLARDSEAARTMGTNLLAPTECHVIGGTWMQLGKLAESVTEDDEPVARWFDLLVLDEASQVEVSTAAAYLLLLKANAHVVLAGDHRQLGPIYRFKMDDSAGGLFDCIFSFMQETHARAPVMLEQNYRTNMEIGNWPKLRFYSEGYEAFHPKRRLQITLPNWGADPPQGWPPLLAWNPEFARILDPGLPVAVITYDARTYTLSNPFEAQIVAALSYLYRRVLMESGAYRGHGDFWTERLSIVTPHRAQMATIRNLLVEAAGMPVDPPPFVDTVDRVQGQERDLIIASYAVADRDFVRAEEEFILDPRRFNVTLTRARSKFVMLVSEALVQHLPSDAQVARDAAHLQLFVENYCSPINEPMRLRFLDNGSPALMQCRLRGRQ
jgi:AAA domain